MTVVINGNTYEVIDGGYHLVATYGLACEISGMDPGSSIDPNELIPKGHISDAGCKIVDNPILDYDGQPTMCVLYEDLMADSSITIDGDENSHDYRYFTYTTTNNIILYPDPYSTTPASAITTESSGGQVTAYTIDDSVSPWYHSNRKNVYNGKTEFNISIRELTIPVRYVSSNVIGAFQNRTTLKTITTHINPVIGQNTFSGCTNLTDVKILGNTNTSHTVALGVGAFSGCTALSSVTIGSYWYNSLNDRVTIFGQCFVGDTALQNIQGQDNIKSISIESFSGCESLDTLTLVNCTNIGAIAFSGCTGLTRAILKGNCTFGNSAFTYCSGFKEIIFLGDCSGNTTIYDMMYHIDQSLSSSAADNLVVRVENQYLSHYQNAFSGMTQSRWYDNLSSNTYNDVSDIVLGEYDDGKGIWDTAVAFDWLKYNTRTVTIYDVEDVENVNIKNGVIKNLHYDSDSGHDNEYSRDSTLVDFDGFRTFTGVTNIDDNAFEGCNSLTIVSIPNSVTTIGSQAFYTCDELSSVTIGSGVTSIDDEAFEGCDDLDSIIIPNSVTSLGENVFSGCTNLKTASIGNGVTEIKYQTFYDCSDLSSITIGSGVTTIGENAFYGCGDLTGITIPNSVTTIDSAAFSGCTSLKSITIPSGVTIIENSTFENCSGSTAITIPSGVTTIGENAFSECIGVRNTVSIPSGVTNIGENAFYNIPHITYYGSATGATWGARCMNGYVVSPYIYEDSGHTILAACFPNFLSGSVPNTVTEIKKYAFYGCTGLTNISIPNSVTSIGDNAFQNCLSLTGITIPNSVSQVNKYTFSWCQGLTNVTLGTGTTVIGEAAFNMCTSLTGITIPSGVTIIGDSAFNTCENISAITLPNDVTTVGKMAFYYCRALTGITIPSKVTTIGYEAFTHCTSLTTLRIGTGVTRIEEWAFADCTALSDIRYDGSTTQWNAITKIGTWIRYANTHYVHCNNGDVYISW